MVLQLIMAFFATISFSILFNIPKAQLLYCGIAGMLSWSIYVSVRSFGWSLVLATFLSAVVVTFVCRRVSFSRKMPLTVFLIPGIIPLVPGAGIYNTMYSVITDDPIQAAAKGIETLKIAGVIAIGIMVILSLPPGLFTKKIITKAGSN